MEWGNIIGGVIGGGSSLIGSGINAKAQKEALNKTAEMQAQKLESMKSLATIAAVTLVIIAVIFLLLKRKK